MESKYETIILERKNGVAALKLNRPEILNAVNFKMIAELHSALDEMAQDESLRVLVFSGMGRAFCAGGDFKGESQTPGSIATDENIRSDEILSKCVSGYVKINLKFQNLEIPTIAMVHGACVGVGFSMIQACDIRIGSEDAKFCVGWTNRGLVPAFGDTWLLPRIIGVGRAAEIIMTGRFVQAEEAERIGILNWLLPNEDLERKTMDLVYKLASGPPIALRHIKVNIYRGFEYDLDTALKSLANSQAICFMSRDFIEATNAFKEKRKPNFKGK